MVTAVDTPVLLDVLTDDPAHRGRSLRAARLVPDFLIGAHAQLRGGRLLTRDRGFYRRFFSKLRIIER